MSSAQTNEEPLSHATASFDGIRTVSGSIHSPPRALSGGRVERPRSQREAKKRKTSVLGKRPRPPRGLRSPRGEEVRLEQRERHHGNRGARLPFEAHVLRSPWAKENWRSRGACPPLPCLCLTHHSSFIISKARPAAFARTIGSRLVGAFVARLISPRHRRSNQPDVLLIVLASPHIPSPCIPTSAR